MMLTSVSVCPANDDLYAGIYVELHRLARRQRHRYRQSETLNTTALVHEAYFKLRGPSDNAQRPRQEFLAIAARAMRQVLVDYARHADADKRSRINVTLEQADRGTDACAPMPLSLLELDLALNKLETLDAQLARITELHVFSGMEFCEIADCEGLSERSVFRLWRKARIFLLEQLTHE